LINKYDGVVKSYPVDS